ncbi:MAG: hypothetical protein K6G85_06950 [Eubacterium sp.]|nr:hypothetical protein [Eubacterium sp.]
MKHEFRKIIAVMCALAVVISSMTVYRSRVVQAEQATVGGLTYTATVSSTNITGAVVQGFFDAGNPSRLHFGWATDAGVEDNDLTATISGTKADTTVVNNQSLTVGGQNSGGCFVQLSELATIGAGTYTITVTDGTDKNLVVALTIAQAEELTPDPNYEPVEGNLLLNAAFAGESKWLQQGATTWTNNSDGSVDIVLPAISSGNSYDHQLVQNAASRGSAFALEAGASYKLKATVASTNERKVEVMVQSNGAAGGNWSVMFLDEIDTVNATSKDLEYDFTVPADTTSGNLNCLVGIMLGKVDNTNAPATTVTVSDMSLVKTASAPEPTTAAPGEYSWVAISDGYYYNSNHTASGIVSIQQPAFAAEQGVYMTVPAGISAVTVNGVAQTTGIDGAGVVVYLSNLTQEVNTVLVTHAGGTSTVLIKNTNAVPTTTAAQETTVTPTTVEPTTVEPTTEEPTTEEPTTVEPTTEEPTTEEPTTEEPTTIVDDCKTSDGISIVGFQIKTNDVSSGVGFRAVFKMPKAASTIQDDDSQPHTISNVGVVYTLDDNNTGDNTKNVYTKAYTILNETPVSGQAWTYEGVNNGNRTVGYILDPEKALLTKLSSDDPQYDYYAVTMQGIFGEMLERTLFVRPFIVDTNNEIVYAEGAAKTSVAQVASDLYVESAMGNVEAHNYLYTAILNSENTIDSKWHRTTPLEYGWNGSIYTPEATTVAP